MHVVYLGIYVAYCVYIGEIDAVPNGDRGPKKVSFLSGCFYLLFIHDQI